MGANLSSLMILSLLFAGVMVALRAAIVSDHLVASSMRELTRHEEGRAMTAMSIASTSAPSVFRCDTKAEVVVENNGEVTLGDFDSMNVLAWYTPDVGGPFTAQFAYTNGNLGKDEWTLLGITPDFANPGRWDPAERATLALRFLTPQKEATSGYVRLIAPNGISASDYVDFANVTSGDCRLLHNNPTPPTGDTLSQAVLPVDSGLPAASTLYNYDLDRDAAPGLKLERTPVGLSETIPQKFQVWRTGPLTSPLIIAADVLIDLWAALIPADSGKPGVVITYLRDYDGSGFTEIGEGAVFSRDWQSGSTTFVEKLALVEGINYTVPTGHELEVRIVVDSSSAQDMNFAYDTDTFPSLVNLSFVAGTSTALLYLHNNPTPPTGDTAAQSVLPMDATVPTATTTLYRYTLPDNNPGLLLKRTPDGLPEPDPAKYQAWRTGVLADPLPIIGDVFIDLWAAIRDYELDQPAAATLYLRDYDGSAYAEIANGSVFAFDWQEGSTTFVKRTIMIPEVNYTVPSGHQLEARLIADIVKASVDMWFAYDTVSYPAVIKLP